MEMATSGADAGPKMTAVTLSLVVLVSLAGLATSNAKWIGGYTLQEGDAESSIAERQGETAEAILAVELDVTGTHITKQGERSRVSHPNVQLNTLQGCRGVYPVQPGDTLFGIARRYGMTLQEILDVNPNLPKSGVIYAGLKLNIHPCAADLDSLEGCADVYIAQPRDTVYKIAQKYGVSVQALLDVNPQLLQPGRLIYPGEKINIPPCTGDFAIEWVV